MNLRINTLIELFTIIRVVIEFGCLNFTAAFALNFSVLHLLYHILILDRFLYLLGAVSTGLNFR